MARPLTIFTGQWADMKLEDLAPLAKKMGYEGLEIALTANHFDITKADDEAYLKGRWDILEKNGLNCYALSNHLVGQCVCDNIDVRHKAILQDTDPGYRVLNLTVSPYNDATTSYFHRSVGGYHGAKLARYQDLIDRYLAYNNQQVLDMLNTRYVIVPGADGQPQAQRRTTAFGAAWFVDSLAPARSAQEEIDLLGEVNLRTTAVVNTSQTEESMQRPMPSGIYDSARIDLAEYRPNYLRYEYSTPEEAIAVFSEIYYDKGWKAFIDGAEAPYFRADYVLRAMRLPAGEHVVEWRFRAPQWTAVESVTGICSGIILLAALVALGVWGVRRFKRPTKPDAAPERPNA